MPTNRKLRLSDLQLVLLSAAAARPDLMVLPPPDGVRTRGGALERSLAALLNRDLVEEVHARLDAETWRTEEDGRRVGLRLAEAGRDALGLDAHDEDAPATTVAPGSELPNGAAPALRKGTKQARLAELLSEPGGATIEALSAELGWQPHTVRAAITGLRKRGLAVLTGPGPDQRRVYRIDAMETCRDAA